MSVNWSLNSLAYHSSPGDEKSKGHRKKKQVDFVNIHQLVFEIDFTHVKFIILEINR